MSRKPQPLYPAPVRKRCPVCGEPSYSAGGVHPQCCVRQADEKRIHRMKQRRKKPAASTVVLDIKPWHKRCPKCRAVVHIRRKTCECGYPLAAR